MTTDITNIPLNKLTAWEKLKKADLANEAERQIVGTGWLPKTLRAAS